MPVSVGNNGAMYHIYTFLVIHQRNGKVSTREITLYSVPCTLHSVQAFGYGTLFL